MDILTFAEENLLISAIVVFVIGFLHGGILGRGIRKRFPSFKRHATAVSVILLILFSLNSISSVLNFATPQKISFSEFVVPLTPEEGAAMIFNFLGLNAGIGSVVATFVSITLILFFKFADINKIARYFIFSLSVIVVTVALISRFTDFVPTGFQILMYAFYQFGITIGIYLITKRKEEDVLSEMN